MTSADRASFNQELMGASSVFGRELSHRDLSRYWYHLQKYEIQEMIDAVRACEATQTSFPLPAELIESIKNIRASRLADVIRAERPELSDEERLAIAADARRLVAELEERMRH